MTVTRAQAWILATRPRTLTAASAPVVAGTGFAGADGVFSLGPAIAALAGGLLIQIGNQPGERLLRLRQRGRHLGAARTHQGHPGRSAGAEVGLARHGGDAGRGLPDRRLPRRGGGLARPGHRPLVAPVRGHVHGRTLSAVVPRPRRHRRLPLLRTRGHRHDVLCAGAGLVHGRRCWRVWGWAPSARPSWW